MKRKLITVLLIALVLSLTLATLGGCFLQNLSVVSGKLNSEAEGALAALNGEAENFSQLNVSYMKMPSPSGNDQVMTATTEYKVTKNGIYYHQHTVSTEPSGRNVETDEEFYLEKDGDDYYRYVSNVAQDGTKSWYVYTLSEDAYDTDTTSNVAEDDRANLFDPKNYKASGDHYKYVGEDVSCTVESFKCWFDVQGLYIDKNGFTIKSKCYPVTQGVTKAQAAEAYSQPGMPVMTLDFNVYAIGSTRISFPRTENAKPNN